MATIARCNYDINGNIIRPSNHEVSRGRVKFDFETYPTFDRGMTHVMMMASSGWDRNHALQRINDKLALFARDAGIHRGYDELDRKFSEGPTPINGQYRITVEILYAVH